MTYCRPALTFTMITFFKIPQLLRAILLWKTQAGHILYRWKNQTTFFIFQSPVIKSTMGIQVSEILMEASWSRKPL